MEAQQAKVNLLRHILRFFPSAQALHQVPVKLQPISLYHAFYKRRSSLRVSFAHGKRLMPGPSSTPYEGRKRPFGATKFFLFRVTEKISHHSRGSPPHSGQGFDIYRAPQDVVITKEGYG
jgi:hypothetical protein